MGAWPRAVACWVLACALAALAASAHADDTAAALRDRYTALERDLAHNAFGRPIHIDSIEAPDWIAGDIHAVLDAPFDRLAASLAAPAPWCDILILHLNVKGCRVVRQGGALQVHLGSKHAQALSAAQRVVFDFHVTASRADLLRIELHAPEGSFGTRDYRIVFEAVPLDAQRSFMHLRYTYRYGFGARMAMQGYLATVASGKVGFSRTGDGYVKGVRGVVERNAMRYTLAIDTYLATYLATASAGSNDLDRRLRRWFAATEQYAMQLHEIDEAEYVAMKRDEIDRQRTPER